MWPLVFGVIALMVNIKTEIPKESSGRLIDALTGIIRPFSERRGLKADQIRLQREEVLIEIAKRPKWRAELEGLSIQPVPNKVLVPLLENASNEQSDSPFLDWWTDVCKALQLLEETTFSCEADAMDLSNRVHTVSFVTFTDLGLEFMRATHRPDLASSHLML